MTRQEQLEQVASMTECMINEFGRRHDINVVFIKLDDEELTLFTKWECQYHRLYTGEERFFIFEIRNPGDIDPQHLLYSVNVTGDSVLAAAGELMNLVSRKF